jgi:hypothetical protein
MLLFLVFENVIAGSGEEISEKWNIHPFGKLT